MKNFTYTLRALLAASGDIYEKAAAKNREQELIRLGSRLDTLKEVLSLLEDHQRKTEGPFKKRTKLVDKVLEELETFIQDTKGREFNDECLQDYKRGYLQGLKLSKLTIVRFLKK